jgi:hypothetical protein
MVVLLLCISSPVQLKTKLGSVYCLPGNSAYCTLALQRKIFSPLTSYVTLLITDSFFPTLLKESSYPPNTPLFSSLPMSKHCGNRFICHNVFQSLFTTLVPKQPPIKRKLSTAVLDQVKRSPMPSTPKVPEAAPCTLELYDYNKLLKSHAKRFHKHNQDQLNSMAILEEMKRNGCQPNSQSYLQLLIGMSRKRHRSHLQNDRMEQWFYEFLRTLDPTWRKKSPLGLLKKAMHTMSFRGHPNLRQMYLKACSLYGDMDVICWNLAMQGCVNSRNMEDAEILLNLAREKKMVNTGSYQILIEGYLKLADQKSSSRIFSYLLQDKVTPDYRIFELFIDFYLTLPAKTETFETVNRLWQAVMMITNVTVPDKMIQQLFGYFYKHGQLAYVEQIYLDVKSRKQQLNKPCLDLLTKVMVGFANKRQLLSALSLFYDLNGEGYRLEDAAVNKIIKSCLANNDKEAAEQLIKVLQELDPNAKIAHTSYNSSLGSKCRKQEKFCNSS